MCNFLDKDVYTDYKEVSSEMQTICFPMLPPVIMNWNATGKKKISYLKINVTMFVRRSGI